MSSSGGNRTSSSPTAITTSTITNATTATTTFSTKCCGSSPSDNDNTGGEKLNNNHRQDESGSSESSSSSSSLVFMTHKDNVATVDAAVVATPPTQSKRTKHTDGCYSSYNDDDDGDERMDHKHCTARELKTTITTSTAMQFLDNDKEKEVDHSPAALQQQQLPNSTSNTDDGDDVGTTTPKYKQEQEEDKDGKLAARPLLPELFRPNNVGETPKCEEEEEEEEDCKPAAQSTPIPSPRGGASCTTAVNHNNNNTDVVVFNEEEEEEDRKPAERASPYAASSLLLCKSASTMDNNHHHIASAMANDHVLEHDEEDRKPAARPTSLPQSSPMTNRHGTTTTTSPTAAATQDWMSTMMMNGGGATSNPNEAAAMQDTTEDVDFALAFQMQLDEMERYDAASEIQMQNEMDDDNVYDNDAQDNSGGDGMHTTITGRAWMFVEQVLKLHNRLKRTTGVAGAAIASPSMSDNVATKSSTVPTVAEGNICPPLILPLASNDMVAMAERLLMKQEEFRLLGKPTHVDIGYHYTRSENLATIQTDGLMSGRERSACDISPARYNGSVFGDGIYTSLNMTTSAHFGDVGLVVARLLGNNALYPDTRRLDRQDGDNDHPDSLTVLLGQLSECTVLGSSQQCIPVFQFDASQLVRFGPEHPQNQMVFEYHVQLQKLIDGMFNGGMATAISDRVQGPNNAPSLISSRPFGYNPGQQPPTSNQSNHAFGPMFAANNFNPLPRPNLPLQVRRPPALPVDPVVPAPQAVLAPINATIRTVSPPTTPVVLSRRTMLAMFGKSDLNHQRLDVRSYTAPESLECSSLDQTDFCHVVREGTHSEISNVCVICLDPLMKVFRYDDTQAKPDSRIIKLRVCEHIFHYGCFHHLLLSSSSSPRCPTCRTNIGVPPQGPMPSGTMEIDTSRSSCAGYESFGTIVVAYSVPSNIQKQYHPHPGRRHGSAYRVAYVPDTTEGRQLLKRLIYAFEHGLTFNVGVSLSTGCDDSVTWSSIHHKTSQSGGTHVHGFPDPNFFANCNQELTDMNVPSADDL